MVANLVVPTATGSDEGAPRPVKTFASSIILSALAVVAVMVLGVFKPSAPSGWQNGLAVDSSTGAAYVTQNNELHAVYNITSARLILGTNFAKFDVPDSTLNGSGVTIGSPVGILGAPEDVPAAGNVNLTQWSFCQTEINASGENAEGGPNFLEIGYAPDASTTQGLWTNQSQQALIVHDSADNVYLIDGDYKYLVGNDQTDKTYVQTILAAVNQDRDLMNPDTTGFWVSQAWLNAFSAGDPLDFPQLKELGGQVSASSTQLSQTIGQYGQVGAGSTANGAVQTANGVVELSPFAYFLYAANKELTGHNVEKLSQPVTASAVNEANSSGAPKAADVFVPKTYGSNWPTFPPTLWGTDTSSSTTQDICVGYNGDIENSTPALTTWVSSQLPYGAPNQQFGLSQSGSNAEAGTVLIKAGYGLVAEKPGGGAQYLIEDSGFRYPLGSGVVSVVGPSASPSPSSTGSGSNSPTTAIKQFGYDGVKVERVPSAWLSLLQGGAELDPAKAGQTPQSGS